MCFNCAHASRLISETLIFIFLNIIIMFICAYLLPEKMSIGELHTDAFLKSLVFEPGNMKYWFRGMLNIFSYKKMMSTVCEKPPTEPPLATSYEAEEKYANWMKSDRSARY